VSIARVGRATVFPARFQLIAAMNPCPCGMAGTGSGTCHCADGVAARYTDRISGPLRDRIDLWVTMTRVPPAILVAATEPEGSAAVAARIRAARARAVSRSGVLTSRLSGRVLRTASRLDRPRERRLVELAELEGMSARGTERLLRVARTIADLAGKDAVDEAALDEAARYRSPARVLDRRLAV
jgi:magnesium chelatase family protein